MATRKLVLDVAGREVTVSNPDKVYFPRTGHTKLDLVRYYLAVADGALRGVAERPMALKRFVNGAEGEFFFQKRAPEKRPEWVETVELRFPSGRSAHEIVVRDAAQLAWVVNLGCIDLNPHPVRAGDLDHPDELRVDLDPMPGVPWSDVLQVALVDQGGPRGLRACRVAQDVGVARLPRLLPDRAPLDLPGGAAGRGRPGPRGRAARPRDRHQQVVEGGAPRGVPGLQPERQGPDRRLRLLGPPGPRPAGVDAAGLGPGAGLPTGGVHPGHRARAGRRGWRRRRGIDGDAGSLEALLELADQHEAAGFADAPWPPHFVKAEGEPSRAQPSKRRQPGPAVREGFVPPPAPGKTAGPTGRRRTTMPLIEVARAATEAEAREGLERWKARHGDVWPLLGPTDVLVDSMRGRSTTWYRIRLNLRNVPEDSRPPQEALEVDYDPWGGRPAGR